MITRHIYDVQLRPTLGSTFQPTGFPDLGAATFDRFEPGTDGPVQAVLVESVQSMANRLEATAWDDAANRPVEAVSGLPYVEVVRAGNDEFLTSSRLEAHRLFSAFVRDSTWDGRPGDQVLLERIGLRPDTPVDYPAIARAVLALDPFSLLHGVFFAGQTKAKGQRTAWATQPKFTRAVSGVIEAHDARRAVYGGRKSDRVRHRDDEEVSGGSTEGYGSIPFHRTEWTAREIVASFVIDVELLRSYGLPAPATDLLETLALWEIRSLLSRGLRLRTACDLEVAGEITTRRGQPLPELDELTGRLRKAIDASAASLGDGKPIRVEWTAAKATRKAEQ
jgi:CRISPR-associated protein Csb1